MKILVKVLLMAGIFIFGGCAAITDRSFSLQPGYREDGTQATAGKPETYLEEKFVAADFMVRCGGNITYGVYLATSKFEFCEYPEGREEWLEVKAVDLIPFIGYWSNKERENRLGWHAHLGLGTSWPFDFDSNKYKLVDKCSRTLMSGRSGLGLDFYFNRSISLILSFDATIRACYLKDEADNLVSAQLGAGGTFLGIRLWW